MANGTHAVMVAHGVSLTLEQAQELLRAAGGSRLYAYVVLSVTTGLRTGNGHLAARDHPAWQRE